MKTLASSVLILGLAVAAGPAAQQSSPDDWCSQERSNSDRETVCEVRQFTVAATAGVLSVTGTNGGISVEGQSRGDVQVLAKVTAHADTEARAREIASAVRVNASLDRVDSDGPRNLRDEDGRSAIAWRCRGRSICPCRPPMAASGSRTSNRTWSSGRRTAA